MAPSLTPKDLITSYGKYWGHRVLPQSTSQHIAEPCKTEDLQHRENLTVLLKYLMRDIAQLAESCLGCMGPWVQSLAIYRLGMVTHTCNPRTWEVKIGGSED